MALRISSLKGGILRAIRPLFGITGRTIDRDRAGEILVAEYKRNGWPWKGPIYLHETLRLYKYASAPNLSSPLSKRTGIIVHIDVITGEVVFSRNTANEQGSGGTDDSSEKT